MKSRLILALVACGVGCRTRPANPVAAPTGHVSACVWDDADRNWLARAMRAWTMTRVRSLRVDSVATPEILLFDATCLFRVDAGARVTAQPHHGSIALPNGRSIRPTALAFTSPATSDSTYFLAIALPRVWSADPKYRFAGENWDEYLTDVFVHEMTHTRMLPVVLPRLRALQSFVRPDSVEDDAVQDRFQSNRAFEASVRRETDLFIRSAKALLPGDRARFAREAVALMRARRAQYYVDSLSVWGELEQAFLDLEGVAQWAAFSHARAVRYGRLPLSDALQKFRSGEQYWSQDEGLAMVLALDALMPQWQARIFSTEGSSVLDLIEEALRRDGSAPA